MVNETKQIREIAIKKLYLLQVVFPVRRLLLREYQDNLDELKNLYTEKFKKKTRNITKAIEKLNREQLISLVKLSSR